jgi:hypothetical protein
LEHNPAVVTLIGKSAAQVKFTAGILTLAISKANKASAGAGQSRTEVVAMKHSQRWEEHI